MNDEQEIDDLEESVCGNVANLSSALSNLTEIDSELMNPEEKKKFKRMKSKIFKALYYYCECLPEITKDENTQNL
jgi:hypothetical protein